MIEPWVWACLLLVVGIALAVMEVFFTSAGILGFLSVASVVGAVIMGFRQNPVVGTMISIGALIGLPTVVVTAFRVLPRTPMGRRLLLGAPTSKEVLPEDPEKEYWKSLIGRRGRAKSKMLLSGVVQIDGQTIDAVSESMPIEVGQAVEIVAVRGHEVVVRPIADEKLVTESNPLEQTYEDPFEIPPLDRS